MNKIVEALRREIDGYQDRHTVNISLTAAEWKEVIAALADHDAQPSDERERFEAACRDGRIGPMLSPPNGLARFKDESYVSARTRAAWSAWQVARAQPTQAEREVAHTDHPSRHFDRTCPACAKGE